MYVKMKQLCPAGVTRWKSLCVDVKVSDKAQGRIQDLIRGGPQIVTGLKLPFWGLSFVEFWCWGLIFGGQGGRAPGPPPGSAPEALSDRLVSSCPWCGVRKHCVPQFLHGMTPIDKLVVTKTFLFMGLVELNEHHFQYIKV